MNGGKCNPSQSSYPLDMYVPTYNTLMGIPIFELELICRLLQTKYGPIFTDVVDILKRGKSKWDICDKEWEI